MFMRTFGCLIALLLPLSACDMLLIARPMSYTSFHTSYLRYEGALYAGCKASRLGPRREAEIRPCEDGARGVGTDQHVFDVSANTWGDRASLPDRGARGIDAGVPVYSTVGVPASERLVAMWHGEMILLERHPLSQGHTGSDLLKHHKSVVVSGFNYGNPPPGTLNPGRQVTEETGQALARALLDAPVDFTADPHGPAYGLWLHIDGQAEQSPSLYYPDARVVILWSDSPAWDVPWGMYFPLRVSEAGRDDLDRVLAEVLAPAAEAPPI